MEINQKTGDYITGELEDVLCEEISNILLEDVREKVNVTIMHVVSLETRVKILQNVSSVLRDVIYENLFLKEII